MWAEALTGVVGGVVGGGVGAGLTGWLAIKADRKRIQREQVSKTYADFLEHLAALSHPEEGSDQTDRRTSMGTAKSRLAATTARIAVYGSADVVERLGEFVEAGRRVGDPKIVSVVEAMREHVGKKQDVRTAIQIIVAGPRGTEGRGV